MAAAVLVIGGGVIGLSAGLELLRAGFSVRIVARELVPDTVSSVAGAIWYPYAVAPRARCDAWARISYDVFGELARDPRTGVTLREGEEFAPPGVAISDLVRGLAGARATPRERVPARYVAGMTFLAPVIDTGVYMPWLVSRFLAEGGSIERGRVASLEAAAREAAVVVNAAGLGARELAPDPGVYPIRGQILRVADARITRFALDHDASGGSSYVIPRGRDVVLGGTRDEHCDDLAVDAAQSADILRRCAALHPSVGESSVIGARVGLRPGRAVVRLEGQRIGPAWVVHAYGHGGAGVTLSWGCAREIVDLASQLRG